MLKKIKNALVRTFKAPFRKVDEWSKNPRFVLVGIVWDTAFGMWFLIYGLYLIFGHRHDYLWGAVEILFAAGMVWFLISQFKLLKKYNYGSEAYHFLKFIDEFHEFQNTHGSGKARADIPFSTKR